MEGQILSIKELRKKLQMNHFLLLSCPLPRCFHPRLRTEGTPAAVDFVSNGKPPLAAITPNPTPHLPPLPLNSSALRFPLDLSHRGWNTRSYHVGRNPSSLAAQTNIATALNLKHTQFAQEAQGDEGLKRVWNGNAQTPERGASALRISSPDN